MRRNQLAWRGCLVAVSASFSLIACGGSDSGSGTGGAGGSVVTVGGAGGSGAVAGMTGTGGAVIGTGGSVGGAGAGTAGVTGTGGASPMDAAMAMGGGAMDAAAAQDANPIVDSGGADTAVPKVTVGGSVTGLVGTGLVLQNNAGDDLPISANGMFTFATALDEGTMFNVTVKTQPSTPSQTCTVSGASGTLGANNVTSLVVNCMSNAFVVGGTISGLAGTVVLQNNAGDDLSVTANGSFAFATPLTSGKSYAVTVKTQPTVPSQTCVIASGSGMVSGAEVTGVLVTCTTNKFTVGGSVSGLNGSVVLRNGGENLLITANGMFVFTQPIASGTTTNVAVQNQPSTTQTCTVTNGGTVVGGANITNVAVTCTTNMYTVGGTVVGLTGSNLVLRNNGGDDVTLSANGGFTFPTSVASGTGFAVTISTQPSAPSQTCNVTGDTGTVGSANVTGVVVNCATNAFTVGGTISGLLGSVVLRDNGNDSVVVSANGSFAFSQTVASGGAYNVTVLTQPSSPAQSCVVSSGMGTVGTANVTGVSVACSTSAFKIGGTLAGLGFGASVTITNNGTDSTTLSTNGTFAFPTSIASGGAYSASVLTQPSSPTQTCTITNGAGTVAGADVANVGINCTTSSFTVGGTVTGLSGLGLVLQNNNGDDLSVGSDGSFVFATKVPSSGGYKVTVKSQPTSPAQNCTVTGDTGTVGAGSVSSVQVNCDTNKFTISGTVSGLVGSGLVLQNNGGGNLSVSTGSFAFPPAPSGSIYQITVLSQPTSPTQTCMVTSGGVGTLGSANVNNVTIACSINKYNVGGTITGLVGGGLVLQNNGTSNLPVAASPFMFTNVPSASGYNVAVLTQPSNPTQTCLVTGGASGTVGSADVNNITIACSTNSYTLGGTVSGLGMGESVVLQSNLGETKTVSANGSYTFPTAQSSGTMYSVAITSQPSDLVHTCSITSPTGTFLSSNASVAVTCTNTCGAGQSVCDGSCTNTMYDPNNCGTCDHVCSYPNAVAGCSGGACLLGACGTGFGDCDHVASNGCEANLNAPANCGACGNACPLGESCNSGSCTTTQWASGFLGYWSMDDAAGSATVKDASGNNLTGTISGSVTMTPGAGKGGTGAAVFNGGYIDVVFPNDAANQGTGVFMPQGNVTYAMWVKTSNSTVQGLQVVWGVTWGGGWDRVIGNGSGGQLNYNSWNEVNFSGAATINDGTWHHVVYVLDKTAGFYAYVDGVLDGSSNTPTNNCGTGCSGFNWASNYRIGTGMNGRFNANAFIGTIDDVRVYNKALSASNVTALYNATK